MTAFFLFLLAAWFLFVLVFTKNNHGRIAIFGPVLITASQCFGFLAVIFHCAFEESKRLNAFIASIGHGKGGEK